MGIVTDLIDEQQSIANGLIHWHKYRRDIAAYVLPHTEVNEYLLSSSPEKAITAMTAGPIAGDKSKDIYDMTSIWAVERLTAGMLSLKTPETSYWQELMVEDEFEDRELSHEEAEALERARNYLFKVRSNPHSGFWPAHKAAMRSMVGFGDGWLFITEELGGMTPWRYEFIPLPELYPACDKAGNPSTMHRPFWLSASQVAQRWPAEKLSAKVVEMANDPKKKHDKVRVMHSVRPRDDDKRSGIGTGNAKYESHYILVDEKHHIGEGGYYEFPFTRYAWNQVGTSAQCEGPVAMALGEIKSLQEMSKQEIMAGASMLRPPMATHGRNFARMNFNPGQNNPGLISATGKQLFAPLNTGARPDFARAIIEAKQNTIKEVLYINLWQTLIQERETTATEALIRAQEKGELLGPVGISLNLGLARSTDREISIMERKGAFREGSPLAFPESLSDVNVAPRFVSPLDRLRQMSELVGMQRLAAFAGELATVTSRPEIAQRLDDEHMLERAQEILGAPVKSLKDKDEFNEQQGQNAQMGQLAAMIEQAKAGGDAMGAIGGGAAAMAEGAAASEAVQKQGQMPKALQGA